MNALGTTGTAGTRPGRLGLAYLLLLAYIVVLYLRPQEFVPSLMGTPIVPALLASAFALWVVLQPKKFEAPQTKLILALTCVIFLSVGLADGFGSAISSTMDFVPTVMLFYIVATSIDSVARFRWLAIVVSAVTGVIALHGIEQANTPDGIGWTGAAMADGRITYVGFFNDPNDLSMSFLMVLPLTVWLAVTHPMRLLRWAAWGVVGLTLWATYLCNSRGSMLGVLAMVMMLAVRRYGWKRALLVGPLILVPLVLAAPSRMSEMSADEESAEGRIDAWYEGFQMLREHPLFGVGKGLFIDHNYLTAHNSFVLAIAELGTIGYYVWLANLTLTVVMLVRLCKVVLPAATAAAGPAGDDAPPAPPAEDWPAVRGVAVALAYSMLGTLVTAFFLSRSYVFVLYLLIAMVAAIHGVARKRWPEQFALLRLSDMAGRIFAFEIGSILFLFVLTRVLLSMG